MILTPQKDLATKNTALLFEVLIGKLHVLILSSASGGPASGLSQWMRRQIGFYVICQFVACTQKVPTLELSFGCFPMRIRFRER